MAVHGPLLGVQEEVLCGVLLQNVAACVYQAFRHVACCRLRPGSCTSIISMLRSKVVVSLVSDMRCHMQHGPCMQNVPRLTLYLTSADQSCLEQEADSVLRCLRFPPFFPTGTMKIAQSLATPQIHTLHAWTRRHTGHLLTQTMAFDGPSCLDPTLCPGHPPHPTATHTTASSRTAAVASVRNPQQRVHALRDGPAVVHGRCASHSRQSCYGLQAAQDRGNHAGTALWSWILCGRCAT